MECKKKHTQKKLQQNQLQQQYKNKKKLNESNYVLSATQLDENNGDKVKKKRTKIK